VVLASLSQMVKDFERKLVKEAIDKFKEDQHPIDKVVKVLGISKATLYRKLNNSQYRELSQK